MFNAKSDLRVYEPLIIDYIGAAHVHIIPKLVHRGPKN
jgi:hypothetical protein